MVKIVNNYSISRAFVFQLSLYVTRFTTQPSIAFVLERVNMSDSSSEDDLSSSSEYTEEDSSSETGSESSESESQSSSESESESESESSESEKGDDSLPQPASSLSSLPPSNLPATPDNAPSGSSLSNLLSYSFRFKLM